jgi:hypothetical protein
MLYGCIIRFEVGISSEECAEHYTTKLKQFGTSVCVLYSTVGCIHFHVIQQEVWSIPESTERNTRGKLMLVGNSVWRSELQPYLLL